jgi:hypothetical protein
MNQNNDHDVDEPIVLHPRPRPQTDMTLTIPRDVEVSLMRVASARDMTVNALLKLYIGQGLRQDIARLFADRVLDVTAQVLSTHGQSADQVSAILQEIRTKTAV